MQASGKNRETMGKIERGRNLEEKYAILYAFLKIMTVIVILPNTTFFVKFKKKISDHPRKAIFTRNFLSFILRAKARV